MTATTIPGRARDEKRLIGWLITIGAAGAIASLTLFGATSGASPAPSDKTLLTDLVLNLVLFVPLGIGLALLGRGSGGAAAIGAVASAMIELAQYRWLPTRDAAVHDVLSNGLGTLLGAFLVHAWPERKRWWRLAGPGLSLGMAMIWLAGSALVRPTMPTRAVWYGFWGHQLGNAVQFPGRILEFSVNGESIPDGLIYGQAGLRERISDADTLLARTRVVLPPPFAGKAQLVSVMSPTGEELLSLWQEGDALLARVRLRVSSVRLRAPWFVLQNGLDGRPGDTLSLTLEATTSTLRMHVGAMSGSQRTGLIRFSPELLWASFVPWDYPVDGGPAGWPLLAAVLIFGAIGLGSTRNPWTGAGIAGVALFAPRLVLGGAASGGLTLGLALLALVVGQTLGRHQGFRED